MAKYTYNKTATLDTLKQEISSQLSDLDYLQQIGASLEVYFLSDLSSENVQLLDSIVAAHTFVVKIEDVTARQIRQALIISGVSLSQIETALDGLSEPTRSLALMEWEYSNMFERNRPLVQQVGVMLNWTPQQLDDLWLLAGTL